VVNVGFSYHASSPVAECFSKNTNKILSYSTSMLIVNHNIILSKIQPLNMTHMSVLHERPEITRIAFFCVGFAINAFVHSRFREILAFQHNLWYN